MTNDSPMPDSPARRRFMEGAGSTALGLAVAAAPSRAEAQEQPQPAAPRPAAPRPKNSRVRIGIAGGRFGTTFQWHLHPRCEVAAVTDLRPERLARLQQVYACDKTYPSLEEMVKDPALDAIGVYTEAPNHFEHVMLALDHGKHCICAVPAAMTLEECEALIDKVKATGLTYMMAETSYYVQEVMRARRLYQAGDFGELFCCEAEYHHDGLESLFWEGGDPSAKRTWRYGFPPMHYPTHSTAMLVGVTGERLTQVACIGWGDDDPILRDNAYNNPFWSATAFFKTDRGHAMRVGVYWKVAARGCERAKWFGSKRSYHMAHPNGLGPILGETGNKITPERVPEYWKDELPEPMRVPSGHGNSHTFLTHEFIDSIANARPPRHQYLRSRRLHRPRHRSSPVRSRRRRPNENPRFRPSANPD